jgi:hypothetical protein
MHSTYALVVREGAPVPDRQFSGAIGILNLALHVKVVHEHFPEAHPLPLAGIAELIQLVCTGAVDASFAESRAAATELRNTTAECAGARLRVHDFPEMVLHAGVASTHEAAGAVSKNPARDRQHVSGRHACRIDRQILVFRSRLYQVVEEAHGGAG